MVVVLTRENENYHPQFTFVSDNVDIHMYDTVWIGYDGSNRLVRGQCLSEPFGISEEGLEKVRQFIQPDEHFPFIAGKYEYREEWFIDATDLRDRDTR